MKSQLTVTVGQYSDAGKKTTNQDFHGAYVPEEPLLSRKGIAIAIADGISSSDVSQVASETAVTGFLADYYCTSDAWSVKTSAQKVLLAINSWLFSQSQNSPHRFNKDKGYICTFSGMVLKGRTAHIFHSGDSRIYRLTTNSFEPLTVDHRHYVSDDSSYLTRALGVHNHLDLDYKTVTLEEGDIYFLATDGVYEFLKKDQIFSSIKQYNQDLNLAAKDLVQRAFEAGSDDNLTLQLVRIDHLPQKGALEVQKEAQELPVPPSLDARMEFDGYTILRDLYISSRSHVYLAQDLTSGQQVVIKTPSTEQKNNASYLEHFLLEDWIAKRLNNPHILKAFQPNRKQSYLYTVSEFIDGYSLKQWMIDHPKPTLDQVRDVVSQVAKGLQAFHRQEMVHQDLRPNNIMIDHNGTAKIIDFGAVKVAGLSDVSDVNHGIVGTMQFSAPEYFLDQLVNHRADIFSLGVIAYQMLSGKLPYGTKVFNATTQSAQRKLRYQSLLEHDPSVPIWVDDAIRKAVSIQPLKRYDEVSEFIYDLKHPNQRFLKKNKAPLIERDPTVFWQGVSFILFGALVSQWLILF